MNITTNFFFFNLGFVKIVNNVTINIKHVIVTVLLNSVRTEASSDTKHEPLLQAIINSISELI